MWFGHSQLRLGIIFAMCDNCSGSNALTPTWYSVLATSGASTLRYERILSEVAGALIACMPWEASNCSIRRGAKA